MACPLLIVKTMLLDNHVSLSFFKSEYALLIDCLTVVKYISNKKNSSYYLGQCIPCPSLILPVRGGPSREENMGHKGKPLPKT